MIRPSGHSDIRRRVKRFIMRPFIPLLLLALIAAFGPLVRAQEMEARAYSPAPVGANIAIFVYSYQSGDVLLDSALPLRDVKVNLNSAIVGYGRTFDLAGRQATASIAVPYIWGGVSGRVFEEQQDVTRSGLGDIFLDHGPAGSVGQVEIQKDHIEWVGRAEQLQPFMRR